MDFCITASQRVAREAFDLDAAMQALPAASSSVVSSRGQAGARLRGFHVARISDAHLRDFAISVLGAIRMSANYLGALRIVLGNQAHAERSGYALEMNIRTDFASERVMRNIIDQMRAAGLTASQEVRLGEGRKQVVQVYERGGPAYLWGYSWSLEAILRAEESVMSERAVGVVWHPWSCGVGADEVPY